MCVLSPCRKGELSSQQLLPLFTNLSYLLNLAEQGEYDSLLLEHEDLVALLLV